MHDDHNDSYDNDNHAHGANHAHGHQPHEPAPGETKEKLLLAYMLEHNRQHVSELISLAVDIENAGGHDTATIIRNAVTDFDTGNEKLEAAFNSL